MREVVDLVPVDAVEVTVLMDNAIDILAAPSDVAGRPPWRWDWSEGEQLRAEHGYSLALTVHRGGSTDRILYDAGLTSDGVTHNLEVLEIDPREFRAVVLSHGHADHHGGLEGVLGRMPRDAPLVLHPDAWRERKVVFPTGAEIRMPPPSRQDLDREGWQIVEETGPSLLLDGAVLVTGQVDRVTDYEKGFPLQFARSHTGWDADTWIWDDQAVVVNVRGRGLVVLSSCSHSGVINVLRHAQRMTGQERIHAFVGGLHLTGGLFEPIVPDTINDLVALSPEIVVPGHCTGWKATHAVAAALPDAFTSSNVGTTFRFVGTAA
ncbi:MAG: MBL fold metallo-hydrolase [Acidimicrobiia bacterium]|nr:MBL fold metallo-hydrolase [Acidimicrobiia bacterium]